MNRLVSIIIPLYNGENYIKDCLDSIISQTYQEIEVIVVDDGSTDNSAGVVSAYKERESKIMFLQKENGGVSSARNLGIENAHGEYLMFVDADDIILDETFVEKMIAYSDKDYVVSGVTHRKFKEDTSFSDSFSTLSPESGNGMKSLPDNFFVNGFMHSSCAKLYKRSIIVQNEIRFPKVRLSEDSLFNIAYIKYVDSWQILNDKDYCYMHRYCGQNATAKFEETDIDIYINLYEEMKKLPLSEKIVNEVIYAQFLATCLRCIRVGDIKKQKNGQKLRTILRKPYVKHILRKTKTTTGEWITGLAVSTGSVWVYHVWALLLKILRR